LNETTFKTIKVEAIDKEDFDLSMIIIWFIATLTVFFGALWTKHEFIQK
jgi:hypothetical protein